MSTKFTPSFIASQKALEEKATKRPWVAEWNFEHHEKGRTVEYYEAWAETPVITGSSLSEVEPQVAADRLYMEAAANNYPATLDEIEQLQTANREMKSQLDIATDLGQKRFEEISALQKRLEKAEKDRDDWRKLNCENKVSGMWWMERADKFEACLKEIQEQAERRNTNWCKRKAEEALKGGEE